MTQYYGDNSSPERHFETEHAPLAPVMKMVDWLIVLIISVLPVVNVIVLIIWALDSSGNPNRRNFSLAMLLLFGLEILLMSVFFGYFTGIIYKVMNMV